MIKKFFILVSFFLSAGFAFAQPGWKEMVSVSDVCKAYPKLINSVFGNLNLDYPGLEKVASAWNNGKPEEACKFLLEYYKNSNTASYLRKSPPVKSTQSDALADTILNYIFEIQNVKGKLPLATNGHRDWNYKGPNNDSEWAWLSNRHSQIDYLLAVYFKTGNPKYAEYIDQFLRDFIIFSMPYPGVKSNTPVWRGLEVAARAKGWSRVFYGLLNSGYLSESTQLLMLASLPDHAHYNRNFHGGNNWLTMEISALVTIATNFPEFKNSPQWLTYSIETISKSMKGQVYPDGTQTELTSHYHNVAMNNFELFENICKRANKQLPEFFSQTIENMYNYISHTIRPDGRRILNNDGDSGSDLNLVLEGAKKYKKPEWEYIATNGKSGKKPSDGPSYMFPWAGHLISRSGFDAEAHWSFFDIGPWGSGHQHNDKLNLTISAYGQDLLVDAGRFAYTGEIARKFRKYATGSQGHNLVLVDGNGQAPGPLLAEKPIPQNQFKITSGFDFASGTYDKFLNTEGFFSHTRSLFYVRESYWVVVDHLKTDRIRKIETLWHLHPDCVVESHENRVVTTVNKYGNLRIIPVGKTNWNVKLVKGQEKPDIQGWYSPEYNVYMPNVTAIYTDVIPADKTYVWLLVPYEKDTPNTKAEIISEDDSGIQIKISMNGKKSNIVSIPFNTNDNAKID